jgi:hypothetical protein
MYILGGVELEITEVQEIYCRTRLVFQILAETLALFVRAFSPLENDVLASLAIRKNYDIIATFPGAPD